MSASRFHVAIVKNTQRGSRDPTFRVSWIVGLCLEPVDSGSDKTAMVDRIEIVLAGLVDKLFEVTMKVLQTRLPGVQVTVDAPPSGELRGT